MQGYISVNDIFQDVKNPNIPSFNQIPMANPLVNQTISDMYNYNSKGINSSFEGLRSILSKEDMAQVYDTFNISNPAPQVFTREDIGAMSRDEFTQNEDAIMKQLKKMGIPTKAELYRQKQKSSNHSHSSSSSSNGSNGEHWVTINGNHVLLDK